MTEPRSFQAREALMLGIACVVTIVWAVATIAQVIAPSHVVPEYANLAMMLVAGSFFTGSIITRKRRNGNGASS